MKEWSSPEQLAEFVIVLSMLQVAMIIPDIDDSSKDVTSKVFHKYLCPFKKKKKEGYL